MSAEKGLEGDLIPRNKLEWRLMLPLACIVTLYAAGVGAVLPVLPFYLREMGASPLIFGLVLSTEALSQSAASPMLGQLSDRFGRKQVLMVSQAVAILSLLVLALAQNIFTVLFARFLFGFTSGNFSVAAAYAADNSSVATRRQAIGIVSASLGLGAILGAGLSSMLVEISLLVPIYMALGLALSGLVVTSVFIKKGKVAKQNVALRNRQQISLRAITSSPVMRVLIIVMLCHFFAYGMYVSQLPNFLAEKFVWNGHALGPREFSYLIAADGMINILVQLFLLGWLGRSLNERQLIVLIFGLIGMGVIVAGLANTIVILAIAVLFVSVGDALAKPTYLAALSVKVPPERHGIVMGTGQALVAVTDVISPALAGLILGWGFYGAWIGTIVAVALFGAIVAAARLPRRMAERVESLP